MITASSKTSSKEGQPQPDLNLEFELIRYFSMSAPMSKSEFEDKTEQELAKIIYKEAFRKSIEIDK